MKFIYSAIVFVLWWAFVIVGAWFGVKLILRFL